MSIFSSRPAKWFYSRVRNRNIFKQSVSLTYKDRNHCLNFLGGISTILIISFIVVYGTLMTIRLGARTDVQWNQNHIEVDTKSNNQTYTLTEEDGVEIMFVGALHSKDDNIFNYTLFLNSVVKLEAYLTENNGTVKTLEKHE